MNHHRPTITLLRYLSGLLLLLLLLPPQTAKATHAAGSDIRYRCLGGLQYEIEVTFYRDCGGVAEPSNITVNCRSVSGNHNINITLNKVSGSSNGNEITVPCATSTSSCNGGSSTGVRRWVYRATVTLPSARADWVFSYSVCCRNCTITTISNPCASNSLLYVEATLNNLNAPCNNSPTFSNIPIAFVCTGQNFNYNHGVLDPDGDSLTYQLIAPKISATANVSFIPPASVTTPLASSTPFSVNATTGDINFTPSAVQIGVMAILVREFRNGQQIGSVIRDMQVYTSTCSNNLPTASGINGSSNFNINACPGQQICFTVNSADVDASQIVSMTTNNGIPNATYTISSGSRPTLTFCWTPTVADIGLNPKTFTVTVRDNACPTNGIQTFSYNIFVPSPYFTTSSTNVSCFGASTGTATASPVYSGSYNYLWSNGATTATATGLTAGTYTVTATDPSAGCSASATVTITQPAGMTVTNSTVNPSCATRNNGSISLNVSGGNPPYTYSWSNGAGSANNTNLSAGTYTATITDASGCTSVQNFTLSNTYSFTATASGNSINCFGQSTGSITVTPAGGVSPFSYSWSNGSSSATLSNVSAGNYSVTITDNNGCTATASASVTQPAAPLTHTLTSNQVNCFGQATGSVTSIVNGGTSPYTYAWSNGSTGSSISNVSAGSYTLTVTDSRGCTSVQNVTVNQPSAALNATSNSTNINCFGQSTGAITLSPSGGTAPYTFSWNNGATTQNLSSLTAGIYTVTITDARGCTFTRSNTLTQPSAVLAGSSSITPVSCFGGSTGTINISTSGGTGPYTYQWSNGSSSQNLTGVTAGTYSVTIQDANNCSATLNALSVSQPSAALSLSSTKNDVNCFGNASGSVSITASGGTTPYAYSWNNGGTSSSISNLAAGTYTVTVTDARNCTVNTTVNITQPAAALNATSTKTDVRCFGNTTGIASVIPSGGTSPYTYTWNTGSTSATTNGLGAGNYTVTITDSKGCTHISTIAINQPAAALSVNGTANSVACFNVATGSINITAAGGTAPYIYQWNNGAAGSNLSNLAAGTYTVTTTDANGCSSTNSYTVTQPAAALNASASSNAVACFGNSTGSITTTVNGGTAPYTYNWNNGSTAASLTGLSAGTYSVTVTDSRGCTTTLSRTVTQPSASLSVSGSSNNVSCFSISNGSAVATPSGGTSPYTYNWSTGASTQGVSSLSPGNYTVTVTDANGCTGTRNYSITQPAAALQVSGTHNDINCTGNSIGSISLTVNGGTAPYSYLWSNGSTQQNISNLSANTYTVTVSDANGCTAQLSQTISQPAGALNVSSAVTNLLCYENGTGSINITPSAGTPPYSYQWSNGSTQEDLNGIPAGTYTVTVSDNNGCSLTNTLFVTQPQEELDAITHATLVGCYGANSGAINLTVSGGTLPYSIQWSNGVTTEDLDEIIAGTYTVTVTDANGCTAFASTNVGEPAAPLGASANQTNLNCHDVNDGSLQLNVSGGTSGYTYSWSTGANTPGISNLTPGNYTVLITDANGCTLSQTYEIIYNAQVLSATHSVIPVACFGNSTGEVNVSVQGGTPPYQYKWDSGQTSQNLTGVAMGNYAVTISDVNGCTTTLSVSVGQPIAALSATQQTTAVLCNGDLSGAIDISASGGTYPYSYNWSNGSTSEDISQLGSGNYTVTITDANGCTLTEQINVIQPAAPLSSSITVDDVKCYGDASGQIQAQLSGGTAPYTYTWNSQAGNDVISQLTAGNYQLSVTDANGCIFQQNITVNEPQDPLSASTQITNIDCNGNSSGSATLQVNGGTAPYSYAWSNNTTNAGISGVNTGQYSYTITDANNCILSGTVDITQPQNALSVSVQQTNAGCFGDASGAIDINVSGGTPGYNFTWSNGQTSEDITGLTAGTYIMTVTDNNNCIFTQSYTISEPAAALSSTDSSLMVSCYGGQDASIQVYPSGGTSPYQYSWNNGGNSSAINGLSAGMYNVLITDANGCTLTQNYTLTQPAAALDATTSTSAVSCYGDSTGAVNLSVTGGTAPYTYVWDNNSNQEDLNAVQAGTYQVTVTDANGCTFSTTANVNQPVAPLSAQMNTSAAACFAQPSGAINTTVQGGTSPYTYLWNTGATVQSPNGMAAGTYTVTVSDANGCELIQNVTISQPQDSLQATASVVHLLCHNQPTGSINLTTSGGTAPYTYLWNNGNTTQHPTQLSAGNYTVLITDANGCTQIYSALVTQPAAYPNVSGLTTPVSCKGQQNGAITLNIAGGTEPFSVIWNTGATSTDLQDLGAGVYTVTVTDANGCSSSYTTQINEPALDLTATSESSPANCISGEMGSVTVTSSGGTAPYTYLWNTGANTAQVNGLAPGNYTVTIFDASGCETTKTISVADSSDLRISSSGNDICIGNKAMISTDSIPNATYQWNFNGTPLTGATTNSFQTPVAGTYTLTVTTACGTYTSNPVEINVRVLNNVSISNSVIICTGETVQLQAGGGVEYTWNPASGLDNPNVSNPVASPDKTTDYTVTVKDQYGCRATATVTVTVMCDTLDIPNGFSPNSDGTNDFFVIDGINNYPGNVLFIYNRWGNLVYKKRDYDNTWDGRSNVNGVMFGQELPNGTYYYILDLNVDQKPLNSFVILRR